MRRYVADHCLGTNTMTASGDSFFIYDPDRDLPAERQLPYATLVTGDRYDRVSQLDRDGVYRLNIGLRRQTYRDLFGAPPTDRDADGLLDTGHDLTQLDTLLPHPFYASQNWVCVLSPSDATFEQTVRPLLDEAYRLAVRKYTNRTGRHET